MTDDEVDEVAGWIHCPACGEDLPPDCFYLRSPGGKHRWACKNCLKKRQRIIDARRRSGEKKAAVAEMERLGEVTLITCPADPEYGDQLYVPGLSVERDSFEETLAAGYWPEGSVWEEISVTGSPTRWQVHGSTLCDVTEKLLRGDR